MSLSLPTHVEGPLNGCFLVDQNKVPGGITNQLAPQVFQSTIDPGNGQDNSTFELKIVPSPAQPKTSDSLGWQRFLAAYQTGKWEICGSAVKSPMIDNLISPHLSVVYDTYGNLMDNKDYFIRYHHLAPPQLPLNRRKQRHDALLRHGITHPHVRPHLQRYVEMAKRIFDCDLVTISFASADEKHIIFLAADGPPLSKVPNCASICSHALLLTGNSDIFYVPDMAKDWRFERLFGQEGFHKEMSHRFHASAPIFLSSSETPCCKETVSSVHAGRFGIFSSKPRPKFDHDDAKCLLDFARMTEEAMENEFLNNFAIESRHLRQESNEIIAALNESLANRLRPVKDFAIVKEEKIQFDNILEDMDEMKTFMDMIRSSLKATTSCLLNGLNLPSILPSYEKSKSNIFHHKNTTSIGEKGRFGHLANNDDKNVLVTYSGDFTLLPEVHSYPSKVLLKNWFDSYKVKASRNRPQLLTRGELSQQVLIDVQEQNSLDCPFGVHSPASGEKDFQPCCCILSKAQVSSLIEPVLPEEAKACLVVPIIADSSSTLKKAPMAMLCILWETDTTISAPQMDFCSTLAAHLTGLACQEQASSMRNEHLNLIRSIQHELRTPLNGLMGVSELLREESQEIGDRQEIDKNWSINPVPQPSKDTVVDDGNILQSNQVKEAVKVLEPQLESIYVSSLMIKRILDDILSVDKMFKETSSKGKQRNKTKHSLVLPLDIVKLVEEICQEELHYFDLQAMRIFRAISSNSTALGSGSTASPNYEIRKSRLTATAVLMHLNQVENVQDEQSKAYLESAKNLGSQSFSTKETIEISLTPPLLVKIDEELFHSLHGCDGEDLQKILGKLINNALRFTPKTGLIQLEIQQSSFLQVYQHLESMEKLVKLEKEKGEMPSCLYSSYEEETNAFSCPLSECNWIRIHLKDTGIGMDRSFLQKHYLKPFEKADEFSQGIGLGSTVAFNMVIMMNGAFSIQSERGIGTQIDLFLPFVKVDKSIGMIGQERNLKKTELQNNSPFRSAQLLGFEEEFGTRNLSKALKSILDKMQIAYEGDQIREDAKTNDQQKRLFIIHENAFSAPKFVFPSGIEQKTAYVMIFLRNTIRLRPESESLSILQRGSHVLFAPPFGPSTWSRFEDMLKNESLDKFQESIQRSEYTSLLPTNLIVDPITVVRSSTLLEQERKEKEELRLEKPDTRKSASEAPLPRLYSAPTETEYMPVLESNRPNKLNKPASSMNSIDAQKALSPFFVLAVEDNPINMRLMTGVLRKLRCPYAEAHNGVEAVEQFIAHRPTLVLLDISLPLMNGFDACIAMRSHRVSYRPQIVAITAFSTTDDKERGLNVCGMDDWHTKPISISTLKRLITEAREEYEKMIKGNEETNLISSLSLTSS